MSSANASEKKKRGRTKSTAHTTIKTGASLQTDGLHLAKKDA